MRTIKSYGQRHLLISSNRFIVTSLAADKPLATIAHNADRFRRFFGEFRIETGKFLNNVSQVFVGDHVRAVLRLDKKSNKLYHIRAYVIKSAGGNRFAKLKSAPSGSPNYIDHLTVDQLGEYLFGDHAATVDNNEKHSGEACVHRDCLEADSDSSSSDDCADSDSDSDSDSSIENVRRPISASDTEDRKRPASPLSDSSTEPPPKKTRAKSPVLSPTLTPVVIQAPGIKTSTSQIVPRQSESPPAVVDDKPPTLTEIGADDVFLAEPAVTLKMESSGTRSASAHWNNVLYRLKRMVTGTPSVLQAMAAVDAQLVTDILQF